MTRARRRAVPCYALLLSLLITAPLLAPGYLLLRDAVSTPRSWLSDTALGLSESAARAVPQDFAVALGSAVLDGGVLVKALLILGLWLAGWGAARLAADLVDAGLPGQFLAATVAIWNPYVAERLLQGHWSLLLGFGCLPWVAVSVLALRKNTRQVHWWSLGFWLALAGLTPTGGLMAAVVALVCCASPGAGARWRDVLGVTGLATVAALPWLVASAGGSLRTYGAAGAPGFDVFASRAEPGLGTLGTLAGLGGIWNADSVPGSRTTWFALVGTLALVALVAAGVHAAWHTRARPLLVLALIAVVAPALAATAPGLAVLQAAAEFAPGLGVLRDSQKWVGLAIPGYAVCAAAAVPVIARRVPVLRPAVVAAAGCAALLAALPDLAFGVGGAVHSVRYPGGYAAVALRINADPAPVAVLPADSMREFSWAPGAPVLDPLPRWVSAEVLTTGDLLIAGVPVPGEGNHARTVQWLLLDGATPEALARAGVGWLVVETSAGEMGSAVTTLAALTPVYADDQIRLYRVSDVGQTPSPRRGVLIAAHLCWLALLVAGAVGAVVRARR
ncbi:hypothetical protein MINS_08450 [Mycolicibacterium insubricum]|uniref:hypothetical protein n=1 Tax=Mycolicibacterium insubricum TaxID=444597 RepID=UPI00138C6B47|nr:hypothetical protein [Mycolicibacterium insubricum]MCB9440482.1 hypothetical protein [Mycolicibacterium sp.]BBZ65416.1 hypothetical protein MINS_08450 [Mycolicibacterium insubricum]